MSNTKNLANLAAALDDGTSGQVLQSTGSGGVQFADSSGSGVTTHTNQSAMISADTSSAYTEGSLHFDLNANVLYVKIGSGAGDGFYAVATVENAAPSINSFSENTGGAGANDLTNATPPNTFTLTAGSNTVITINATEPNLETISYSATVTSGTATDVFSSPSFPVTNQSSNVFTLTPVTSGTGGTVTIRFDASDGTNVASVSHSFEIAFQIADSHYTTLLMATDGSAGDNNDITDSSSNNHPITVTGDAHAGTFSPYRQGGYSTYFDGTGDYLAVGSNAAFGLGTGDFTAECWIYPLSVPNTYVGIFGTLNTGTPVGFTLSTDSSGNITYVFNNAVASAFTNNTTSTKWVANTWQHIAITRSSNSVRIFLNGTQIGTTKTDSADLGSSDDLVIGRTYTNYDGFYFDGYLSDVRIVKGNGLYTNNFTPPTERLTAVTNTSLLTCHLPYIADTPPSGGTAKTITVNGSTSTKPFGPYDYSEYAESDNGGSVYFDGTGDYATASAPSMSGSWTVEFWAYALNSGSQQTLVSFNSGSSTGVHIWRNGSNQLVVDDGVNAQSAFTGKTIKVNAWSHIAVVRNGTTTTGYINGVSVGSHSFTPSSVNSISVGRYNSSPYYYYNGYISDLRLVNGTAVYSGNFTPPTGPLTTTGGTYPSTTNVDTSITASNTKLLLKGTDAHVIDKSQVSNLKLFNDAAAVTDAPNNSTISSTNALSLDGTGDYATATITPINGADFTVEAWVRKSAQGSTQVICGTRTTSSDTTGFSLAVNSANELAFYTNAYNAESSSLNFPANTWVHVAAVRSGNSLTLYKDGFSVATGTSSHTFSKDVMYIGQNVSTQYWNGYIQDLRVSVGKARTISVPSAPLKG